MIPKYNIFSATGDPLSAWALGHICLVVQQIKNGRHEHLPDRCIRIRRAC